MANRKLPFGYRMANGQIVIEETEAAVARQIFEHYVSGASYQALAQALNRKAVPYGTGRPWNKNAVARLLQNPRYTGAKGFPTIIPEELFQQAVPACSGPAGRPELKALRILARCPLCGGAVRRERADKWRCPVCMTAPLPLTDGGLIRQTAELLQMLRSEPDIIAAPKEPQNDEAIQAAQAAFTHQLEQTEFDERGANAAALALASARLNALSTADYETTRIRRLLEQSESGPGLDTQLLGQIAAAILPDTGGILRLKLKNGQIIEKDR